jgi:outer membrane protein TolC
MDSLKKISRIVLYALWFISGQSYGQNSVKRYTLQEVIDMAKARSPKVLEAKAAFLANYLAHRSFIVSNLPQISLSPLSYSYNHSLMPSYAKDSFLVANVVNKGVGLNISQNIPYTNGQLTVSSNLMSAKDLNGLAPNYSTNLYSIQYSQPLTLFNNFKWERQTDLLRMEQAKRLYVQAIEDISSGAVDLFFELASAQINYEITKLNYSNADTLYKLSKGRYQIGKIVESDLLQMQLNYLQSGIAITTAKLTMETQESNLSTFLALPPDEKFELIIPTEHPYFSVDFNKALQLVKENNPDMLAANMKLIETKKNVKQIFWDNWLNNASITAAYGLSSQGSVMNKLTNNPSVASGFSVGISIPILGYGIRKGKYRLAQLNQLIATEQADQQFNSMKKNVLNVVTQLEQQNDLLRIAALSDTIAQKRYFISKQRFIMGKIDVLDLNKATTDKDNSRNQYISALHNYWRIYYQLRKLSLFDFFAEKPIQVDFEELLKN